MSHQRRVDAIIATIANEVATSVQRDVPEYDAGRLSAPLNAALNEILLGRLTRLNRGEAQALLGSLAKLVGAGPIFGEPVGTQKRITDEFEFEGFTSRGTPSFRHRQTNRVLYVVVEQSGGELRVGMYDRQAEQFQAFVRTADALSWVRGGDPGKRTANLLWDYP